MGLIITISLLVAMFLIGVIKTVKPDSVTVFFVSGRTGSVFRITGSLVATIIGGSATLGLAGLGFTIGLPAAWWLFSGSICLFILGLFFAEKVRRYEVYSLPKILELQYNSNVLRIIASVVILIAWIGVIAAQITAAGKIMSILWPGQYILSVIICGAIFITYTVIGGQHSVIKTEVFQSVLIFTGTILVFIILVQNFGSPWKLNLPEGHLRFPVNQKFGYTDILSYFLLVGTSFLAGPDMYSRILSAKDEITAKYSVFIAAVLIAIIALVIVLLGIYGKAIFPFIEAESVFPQLIINVLPDWIKGIVVAALLAAFLSSADTCLITSSIILTADIINPLFLKNKTTDKKQILITRFIIIILGIMSILLTLYMGGIIKSMLFALTIYTTGLIIPVLFGFYKDRFNLNSSGALAAVLTGSIGAVILKTMSLNQYLIFIFPSVAIILFAVSYLTTRRFFLIKI